MANIMTEMEQALRSRYAQEPMENQSRFAATGGQEGRDLASVYQNRTGVQTSFKPVEAPVDTMDMPAQLQTSLPQGQMEASGMSGVGSAAGGAAGVAQSAGASGAVSGALSGAAMGSAAGPWGAVIGAGVGLVAGMFGDKAKQEAERRQRIIESLKEESLQIQRAQQQLQVGSQRGIETQLQGYARALR